MSIGPQVHDPKLPLPVPLRVAFVGNELPIARKCYSPDHSFQICEPYREITFAYEQIVVVVAADPIQIVCSGHEKKFFAVFRHSRTIGVDAL